MNYKGYEIMKRVLTFFLSLFFSVNVYAYADTKISDRQKNQKTVEYGVIIEPEESQIMYGGKVIESDTFTYKGIKYVPIRSIVNLIGKDISYDSTNGNINIIDSEGGENVNAFKIDITDNNAKFAYNKVYYNGTALENVSNEYSREAEKNRKIDTTIFNVGGYSYISLKYLTESLGLIREYDDNKIIITEPTDRLRYIQGAKAGYKEYCKEYTGDEIDADIIKEALQRQWSHYSEPAVIEQKYTIIYYEGKPAVQVDTSILNYDAYLISNVYEICG